MNQQARKPAPSLARIVVACAAVFAAALLWTRPVLTQSRVEVAPGAAVEYERLLAIIARIPIFDHHAHPGFADDQDIDPAPPTPGGVLQRLRPENLDWTAAARALFGYPFADLDGDHGAWLKKAMAERRRSRTGVTYFNRVLDSVGIETSMANRIAMADYLDSHRFRWVFYADAFMFALDTTHLASRNPDQQAYMPEQAKLLQRYERQVGVTSRAASYDQYLAFVSRVLEDQQRRGAVAAKFEAAYFRSLRFDDPPRAQAAAVYEKYRAGGVPTDEEYSLFQDAIFRHIVVECGRLHLPVHIHSSTGSGPYFTQGHVRVLNLENVLRDPRYLNTTFVLIHGGYPSYREAITLASMPNVYLDSSATGSFLLYPTPFKEVLRTWLVQSPEKVTFGSDAFPADDTLGAELMYWMGVHNARTALSAALAEMVASKEISEKTAIAYAHGYLHDTAAKLYPPAPAGRPTP